MAHDIAGDALISLASLPTSQSFAFRRTESAALMQLDMTGECGVGLLKAIAGRVVELHGLVN